MYLTIYRSEPPNRTESFQTLVEWTRDPASIWFEVPQHLLSIMFKPFGLAGMGFCMKRRLYTPYRVQHLIVPKLPDDHLILSEWDPELQRVAGKYRNGHITPELLHDLEEIHRHLARIGMVRPGDPGEPDEWWFEWAPKETLPLLTISTRTGFLTSGARFFEFRCRSDMISKDLIDEINEWATAQYRGKLDQ